jgi:hypothetical protein
MIQDGGGNSHHAFFCTLLHSLVLISLLFFASKDNVLARSLYQKKTSGSVDDGVGGSKGLGMFFHAVYFLCVNKKLYAT